MFQVAYEADWYLTGLWLLMSMGTVAIWGVVSWAVVGILRHRDRHHTSTPEVFEGGQSDGAPLRHVSSAAT
jgi:hypothetical protein